MHQTNITVPLERRPGLREILKGSLNFVCIVPFIYNEKQSHTNFLLKDFFNEEKGKKSTN